MKNLLLLFFFISFFFNLGFSQCEKCRIKRYQRPLIANKNTLADIIDGKFIDVYKNLNNNVTKRGKYYDRIFNQVRYGEGCFYFYYAYAALGEAFDDNKAFRDFILNNKKSNSTLLKERALIGCNFALDIIKDKDCLSKLKIDRRSLEGIKENLNRIKVKLEKPNNIIPPPPDPKPTSTDIELKQIEVKPINPTLGQPCELTYYLLNKGTKTLYNLPIKYKIDSEERTQIIPKLSPQVSSKFGIDFTPQNTGYIQIKISVNEEGSIEELTLENNTLLKNIFINKSNISSKRLLFLSNQNGSNNLAQDVTINPFNSKSGTNHNCIELMHLFKKNDFQTKTSQEIDDLFFYRFNRFIIENNIERKNLLIKITGYADGQPFIEGKSLNNKGYSLHKEKYYSLNDNGDGKKTKKGNKISNNEDLAFIRAFTLKIKMQERFGLKGEQIKIFTYVDNRKNDEYLRHASLEICSEKLTDNILDQFQVEMTKDLKGENYYSNKDKIVTTTTPIPKLKIVEINPTKTPKITLNKEIKIRNIISFKIGSAVLEESSQDAIEEIYNILFQNPKIVVEIGGHTNRFCKKSDCISLSQDRAIKVVNALADRGIDIKRLKPVGYGYSKPKDKRKDAEYQKINQRVEFKVIGHL